MASDDEMRDKLTAALIRSDWYAVSDYALDDIRRIRDALLPPMRDALADAWDAGWEAGTQYDQDNPWREGD